MITRTLLLLILSLSVEARGAEPAPDLSKVVQAQQASYRQEAWQEFFGRARYYRSRGTYNARLTALEVSGLSKHCLWKEAGALLDWGQDRYPGAELESARTHLHLKKQFPIEMTAQARPEIPSSVFSPQVYWPANIDVVDQLGDPERIRVVVVSQCQEEQ